jgi:hypothetical protein
MTDKLLFRSGSSKISFTSLKHPAGAHPSSYSLGTGESFLGSEVAMASNQALTFIYYRG